MPAYAFKQVDVFTGQPLGGNPVAVVLGADGIDPATMQRIAAWTNLSETTFVLRPSSAEADYRLRIFTPAGELPFAGHPTVGSAHAVLEAGGVTPRNGHFVQECDAGNLPMRVEGEGRERLIFVAAPEAMLAGKHNGLAATVSDALGRPIAGSPEPTAMRNGPTWLFVRYPDSGDIAALAPDMGAVNRISDEHSLTGIAAFALLEGEGPRVHIRCFAPAAGVPEDPVTGSANAALPAYLAHHGMLDRAGRSYVARQGAELGRDGRVHVRVLDATGRAEIGGQAVTVIEGEIRI